jgi:phosphoesterase RecJ-like protein
MRYKESRQIRKEIKKARRILLNCHRSPDPDSIGCALALYHVLKKMGKSADIVCPSDQLYNNVSFLKGYEVIQKGVNFLGFDYSKYDLFVTLDSSDWQQVSGDKNIPLPNVSFVVIDHHATNPGYGKVNLIDTKTISVGEILFRVFQDWEITISKDVANCLMAAIIGDTGAFKFPGVTPKTFRAAENLVKLGADKDRIIFHIFQCEGLDLIQFYAEVLSKIKLDEKGKFVWSAVPFEIYDKMSDESKGNAKAANTFAQKIKGTDFGLVMIEKKKGELNVSFRSRTGIDTSMIAKELGGGGHSAASGATVKDLPFDRAVESVLQTVRKFARK